LVAAVLVVVVFFCREFFVRYCSEKTSFHFEFLLLLYNRLICYCFFEKIYINKSVCVCVYFFCHTKQKKMKNIYLNVRESGKINTEKLENKNWLIKINK